MRRALQEKQSAHDKVAASLAEAQSRLGSESQALADLRRDFELKESALSLAKEEHGRLQERLGVIEAQLASATSREQKAASAYQETVAAIKAQLESARQDELTTSEQHKRVLQEKQTAYDEVAAALAEAQAKSSSLNAELELTKARLSAITQRQQEAELAHQKAVAELEQKHTAESAAAQGMKVTELEEAQRVREALNVHIQAKAHELAALREELEAKARLLGETRQALQTAETRTQQTNALLVQAREEKARIEEASKVETKRLEADYSRKLQAAKERLAEKETALQRAHAQEIEQLKKAHAAALAEKTAEIAQKNQEIASLQSQLDAERRKDPKESEAYIALQKKLKIEVGTWQAQIDKKVSELKARSEEIDRLKSEHERRISELRASHQLALDEAKKGSAAKVDELEQKHSEEIQRREAGYKQKMQELEGQLTSLRAQKAEVGNALATKGSEAAASAQRIAQIEAALGEVKGQLEQAAKRHQEEISGLKAAHESDKALALQEQKEIINGLKALHENSLEGVRSERQRALAKAENLEKTAARHQAEIEKLKKELEKYKMAADQSSSINSSVAAKGKDSKEQTTLELLNTLIKMKPEELTAKILKEKVEGSRATKLFNTLIECRELERISRLTDEELSMHTPDQLAPIACVMMNKIKFLSSRIATLETTNKRLESAGKLHAGAGDLEAKQKELRDKVRKLEDDADLKDTEIAKLKKLLAANGNGTISLKKTGTENQ
jgi:chromosome segregation ATPase